VSRPRSETMLSTPIGTLPNRSSSFSPPPLILVERALGHNDCVKYSPCNTYHMCSPSSVSRNPFSLAFSRLPSVSRSSLPLLHHTSSSLLPLPTSYYDRLSPIAQLQTIHLPNLRPRRRKLPYPSHQAPHRTRPLPSSRRPSKGGRHLAQGERSARCEGRIRPGWRVV
jgi:hypothetical protein